MILQNYDKYFPHYHHALSDAKILLSNFCVALAVTEKNNGNNSKAKELLNEGKKYINSAEDILKVSHGENNPLLNDVCKIIQQRILYGSILTSQNSNKWLLNGDIVMFRCMQ